MISLQQIMARSRLLSGVPEFARSPTEILMGLSKLAREEQFDAGKVIIQEGEPGTRLFVIVSGEVRVTCQSKEDTVVLATLGKGDMFGEVAVAIPNTPRTATITALTAVTAFSISVEDLDRMCAEHPPVRLKLEALAKKILLLNFIKRSSPFSVLPQDKVDALIKRLKLLRVQPNTTIIDQGDRGHYCYLLKSGSVDVVLKRASEEKKVATLFPGALFGEASLLASSTRSAAVISRDVCEILAVGKQDLFDAVLTDRQLASHMMELLRLRDRPKRNPDVVEQVVRQDERGEAVVLKNTMAGTYYRLTPEGKFLWDLLDGTRTLRDLSQVYFEKYKSVTPQAIAEVVGGLGNAGFLESSAWNKSAQKLLVRLPPLAKATARIKKALTVVVMKRHVDEWFARWHQRIVRHLFSVPALVVEAGIAAAGLIGFSIMTPAIIALLPKYPPTQFLSLLPFLLIVGVMQELGHGFAVKYFGREVVGVGFGWRWMAPIVFVDTSDMWLESQQPQILVQLAGLVTSLVFVGLVMVPAWVVGASHHYSVYAWVFSAASYGIAVIKLLPFLRKLF
ncbi:MAG: hypothetical protein COV45_00295 [Deltaproteobacteria bacterium CG11_big_fil_rev_8_21_14_0_20_47_16]|nr:MAG: hypothetical protein COV45_00295 [Deltaproteobacteria bacterium CG11_big_fil_rev_8_21_14_0_20_47_16]